MPGQQRQVVTKVVTTTVTTYTPNAKGGEDKNVEITTDTTETTTTNDVGNSIKPRILGNMQGLTITSKDKPEKYTEVSPEEQKIELEKSTLKAHNQYRAKHGVPDLILSKDLCEMAQKWADHLASLDSGKHSECMLNGKRVGENLANAWSSSGDLLTGEQATDMWYEEIKFYDFNKPGFKSGIGHFTQVVWKESKELGVGRSRAKEGGYYVVANYRPAGNDIDTFKENVFEPKE